VNIDEERVNSAGLRPTRRATWNANRGSNTKPAGILRAVSSRKQAARQDTRDSARARRFGEPARSLGMGSGRSMCRASSDLFHQLELAAM